MTIIGPNTPQTWKNAGDLQPSPAASALPLIDRPEDLIPLLLDHLDELLPRLVVSEKIIAARHKFADDLAFGERLRKPPMTPQKIIAGISWRDRSKPDLPQCGWSLLTFMALVVGAILSVPAGVRIPRARVFDMILLHEPLLNNLFWIRTQGDRRLVTTTSAGVLVLKARVRVRLKRVAHFPETDLLDLSKRYRRTTLPVRSN